MKNRSFILVFVLLLGAMLVTQCSPAATPTKAPEKPPAAQPTQPAAQAAAPTQPPAAGGLDGKALAETRCTACHSFDRIQAAKKSADGWKATVERMVGKGAQLNTDEQKAVMEYLAKTYPQ